MKKILLGLFASAMLLAMGVQAAEVLLVENGKSAFSIT